MATLPSTRAPGSTSCIRLIERRNVDLPQPDGPISAVTLRGAAASEMSKSACFSPYQNENFSARTNPRSVCVALSVGMGVRVVADVEEAGLGARTLAVIRTDP